MCVCACCVYNWLCVLFVMYCVVLCGLLLLCLSVFMCVFVKGVCVVCELLYAVV